MRRVAGGALLVFVLAGTGWAAPNHWGYDYDESYDAVKAAPDVHRLKYEDDHIQFLEVANPPGYHMAMHGHPYPSVFAFSTATVVENRLAAKDRYLDPDSPRNGQQWRTAPPPAGSAFPTCTSASPQAPHLPYNGSDTPLHFFRIEFKRVDQDELPLLPTRYRRAGAERVRYEDDATRLVEVTLAPGAHQALSDARYPAVLAFDTVAAFEAVAQAVGSSAGRSDPPEGLQMPRCVTIAAERRKELVNRSKAPIHYYRVDFKRLDSPGLKEHWREWYPYMLQMMSAGGGVQAAQPVTLDPVLSNDLILANRILVQQGIIDVRGHVSVRDPTNPQHFWITRAVAPGLAVKEDLQEFDLDGTQISGHPGTPYTERFIHARIYRARPDVRSVVHAHTPSLTTFSVSGIALVPVMISATFAADGVPVFVNGEFGEGIHDAKVGDALARALGDKAAILMRGHGAVVVGASIQSAVGRSVGLDANAMMQMRVLSMGGKPIVLHPPPGAAANAGDYAREWSWWKATLPQP